jgi:hypothetical protein
MMQNPYLRRRGGRPRTCAGTSTLDALTLLH